MPRTVYEDADYSYDIQVPFIASEDIEVPTYGFEETTNYRTEPRKVITQRTLTHKHSEPHSDDEHHEEY